MVTKVLIDADIFIALRYKDDALHQKAYQLLKLLKQQPDQKLFTSWDVIDETATKLFYFLTKQDSVDFLQYLRDYKIRIIYPTKDRARRAEQLFRSITSKQVSLTDCMNIVIAKEFELDAVFSFDKAYQQQGVKLLSDILK